MSAVTTPIIQRHRAAGQWQAIVDGGFSALIETIGRCRTSLAPAIVAAASLIGDCLKRGGKVLACGNGGSAAAAQHFAARMVCRLREGRRSGLRAIALTADSAVLTGWSNEAGYEDVFARQVETLGQGGDVLVCASTSGRSPNLVEASRRARQAGISCIALLGAKGGALAAAADLAIPAPASDPQRVQEAHLFILHLILELVESQLGGHDG
ncbi:MAG: SIS domain-containing protein [Syntrophorhabdales bacterium]|jgi:phosphoheptose isomerase